MKHMWWVVSLMFICGSQAQVPSAFNAQVEKAGVVYAMARQADGKILLGGSFEYVNGVPRNNLARLNADGTLDETWIPDPDNTVKSIAVSGTNIVVGGFFTNIGGRARNRVAALDYSTGRALLNTWVQGANAEVRALAITGSVVYVGGVFTQLSGAGRSRLARADSRGVLSSAFTNGANNAVNCLTLLGTNLLVGGDFSQIGGVTRSYLLKVSGWNGAAMAWEGRPNSSVLCSSFDGGNLFVGGSFSYVSSTARVAIVRLDSEYGYLDATWNAGLLYPQYVRAIASDAQSVYVAGMITNLGGYLCEKFAKVSLASGAAFTTWSNNPDNDVSGIIVSGTNVFIGGRFGHLGSQWASSVARLLTNGSRDVSFPARVCDPGYVSCIATQSEGRVLIGGSFESIDGVDMPNAARFLADGSLDVAWQPRTDSTVNKMVLVGTNVYLAGSFSYLGSRECYGLAKVSDQNGLLLAGWTNRLQGVVHSIAADPVYLYAGGTVTNINGQAYRYLARFSHSNNRPDTGWKPVVSNTIFVMEADGTHLYVGGAFRYLNAAVSNLARITLSSGTTDTTWHPNPDDWLLTMALDDDYVYVAGYFSAIGGVSIPQFARVHKAGSGLGDAAWEPNQWGGLVDAILPAEDYIYAAGAFVGIGDESFPHLARLNRTTGLADPTWMPEPDADVYAVMRQGNSVWAGGLFSNIGGMHRMAFAEIEPFSVSGLTVGGDRIPVLTWRGGSNRTYSVDFIGSPTYPYTEVTNGLSGDGEIQTYVDPGRWNYPRLFYRVWEE